MDRIVGIGAMATSRDPNDVITTYSLGSCIGLTLYDPVARVGGMVHTMLPLSKMEPEKAKVKPEMFTDTGVMRLLQHLLDMGAKKARLEAKIAGASTLLDDKKMFRIGERNYAVVRKLLWKNEIMIKGEECGGSKSRTLVLYMADGRTVIRSQRQEVEI